MITIDAIHMREINMPLAYPFETSFGLTTGRRILLVEIEADGLTAWGECVAGEHPYFSDEMIDTSAPTTRMDVNRPSLVSSMLVVVAPTSSSPLGCMAVMTSSSRR